jgi:hypothetical protein
VPRIFAAVLLVCLLCVTAAPLVPATGRTCVELAPAKTRVGIARINLDVRDLRLEGDDTIVGVYEIKIPMAPWRNDSGEISLHAPEPLEQLTADGGTLSGSGLSVEDGRIHEIVCEFEADGFVDIHVISPDRELEFRTRYELVNR